MFQSRVTINFDFPSTTANRARTDEFALWVPFILYCNFTLSSIYKN